MEGRRGKGGGVEPFARVNGRVDGLSIDVVAGEVGGQPGVVNWLPDEVDGEGRWGVWQRGRAEEADGGEAGG